MSGGAVRPPQYTPPAGTPSGIPGAAYAVMGSAPVSNMQPAYGAPGLAQMRPGMPQPAPQVPQSHPMLMGRNPQQLATALTQLSGGIRGQR